MIKINLQIYKNSFILKKVKKNLIFQHNHHQGGKNEQGI